MSLLEARQVSVTPPGAPDPVVRGISFQVARGEWVALSGPNGGGKSSLLLGLAGLWPPGGEVRIAGQPMARGAATPAGVSVILQDPSSQILQPTIYDEIAFGLENSGLSGAETEERVRRVARDLGLSPELCHDPARLSAGRQQLVLLAAALAGDVDLLLADEPTAHLDQATRALVLDQVAGRVAQGMAVIWVTQVPEELGRAHRVIEVGKTSSQPALDPHPAPLAEPDPLLWLRVAPLTDMMGPRVATRTKLEIPVGSRGVTAIAGSNGTGKSVLLWAAAGLGAPAQVTVEWVSPPVPSPIAALQFPELQIFEELAADELVFASISRGLTRERALERVRNLLGDLKLDAEVLMSKRTWLLAAGEKRLVEVVAALVAPSCLYLLDEPTAGLDPIRRKALAEQVRAVAVERPVLVASQDLDWLRSVGSRIVSLDDEHLNRP